MSPDPEGGRHNSEFRNNPEHFHPCTRCRSVKMSKSPKMSIELIPHHVCTIFDCQGSVSKVPVPEGGSDKGVLFKDLIISAVVEHFITACPHGIKFLHDSRGPFLVL